MPVSVNLQTVHPRKLAAVGREVAPGAVGSAWGPALGKVWEFIRSKPGPRTDGHNIFLYHRTRPLVSRAVVVASGASGCAGRTKTGARPGCRRRRFAGNNSPGGRAGRRC